MSAVSDGGTIAISAPTISIVDGAIVATATLGDGQAGDLRLAAERVVVSRGGSLDSSAARGGGAGTIDIQATESVVVQGEGGAEGQEFPSRIRSITANRGNAGTIRISAPDVVVEDGGAIYTSSVGRFAQGSAGDVSLLADAVSVRGGGRIDSSSFGPGPGGSITIAASEAIEITGSGSEILAKAGGSGDGGNVVLEAGRVDVSNGGGISAESSAGLGAAGGLFRDLVEGGVFEEVELPQTATGDAGNVQITASETVRLQGGTIRARADGAGAGGDIMILGNRITLSEGGLIEARSEESNAGDIALGSLTRPVGSIEVGGRSAMSTEALAGNGGNVTLYARELVRLSGSEISANTGDGQGGNVTIDPTAVVLESGRIVARAGAGQGGAIRINADIFLASPDSIVDASARNPELSGSVEINAPDTDLASQITKLPESFLDASNLLQQHCAARGGASGSFKATGLGGIPASPDGFLSASLSQPEGSEALGSVVLSRASEPQRVSSPGGG